MNVGSLIYRLNLTTHCHMGHEWACYPVRQSASHLCPQLDSLQSAATQWGHFSGLPAGHEFHFTIQDSKDLEVFASNTLGLLIVGNYVLVWVRFESWFYLLIEHYGNATNKQLKKKEKKKKKKWACAVYLHIYDWPVHQRLYLYTQTMEIPVCLASPEFFLEPMSRLGGQRRMNNATDADKANQWSKPASLTLMFCTH